MIAAFSTSRFPLNPAWVVTLLCTIQPVCIAADVMRFMNHPLYGRIFDTARNVYITSDDLLDRLHAEQHILVGEKHDNSEHHRLQRQILATLAGKRTSVVFEMLDDGQSSAIATLDPGDSPQIIRDKLGWDENSWSWEDYGPLIHHALSAGSRVVAGNLDRNQVLALYGGDETGLADGPAFDSLAVLNETERESIREALFVSHCEMMPRESLDPLVTIQIARDASMANAMGRALTDDVTLRTILLAGGFHVRRDVGVPRHLSHRSPQQRVAVLQLEEVDPALPEPADYAAVSRQQADYVWFTAAAPEQDYCADLRSEAGKPAVHPAHRAHLAPRWQRSPGVQFTRSDRDPVSSHSCTSGGTSAAA